MSITSSHETGRKYKLHPLTPVVTAAPVLPGMLVALIAFGGGGIRSMGLWAVPSAIGLALLLTLLVLVISYFSWRRFEYWFDDAGDFRVDSGILYRNERRLQLSRLQSVDVVQPLVARIVGMASLRIEVAGSGDSKAVLSYLTAAEADQLRLEIVSRSAGGRIVDPKSSSPQADPSESVLASVSPADLGISLLLRSSTAGLLALTVLIVGMTFLTSGVTGVALIPFTGGIPLVMIISEFAVFFGFTATHSRDGIRLHHGLLQTQVQTVPPGRVSAVDFIEPFLWRRKGWVRIRMTVAGIGKTDDGSGGLSQSTLLPVATWDVAREIFAQIVPGSNLDEITLTSVHRRARWRAPIQWSRLAWGYDSSVFVARRGRITRHLTVVPHARTQSVRVMQGPYSRWLDLASVYVDVPPGPVSVAALYCPAEAGRNIAQSQADRARLARSTDRSTHWASPDASPFKGSS